MAKAVVNKNGNFEIGVKKLVKDAQLPIRGSERAACYDLVANSIEEVAAGKVKIKFGIACDIPEGYKLCIVPRSSFCLKGWIQANSPGQVDEDYKGELMMFIEGIPQAIVTKDYEHLGSELGFQYNEIPYKVGDRCAQMFLQKVEPSEIVEVDDIGTSVRGEGGFGSTGN